MRLSRRQGLINGYQVPSLYDFWSDAVVVSSFGQSNSTAQQFRNINIGDTSTPVYAIVTKGDAVYIRRIVNNTVGWYDTKWTNSAEYLLQIGIEWEGSTTASTKVMVVGGQMEDLYGYSMHLLRFPSYSDDVVRAVLGNRLRVAMEFLSGAYNYGSSASTCSISDSDLSSDPNVVYLQMGCTASAGYFSVTRGGSPTTALTSGPSSGVYWRHASSAYYLRSGVSSTSNASTRAGGIYRMYRIY